MVLAAIMLKLGAYGFLRFSLPSRLTRLAWVGLDRRLSLIAVVYIGLVAMVQSDMKKLVAYSSIAHMGFVTLGFFCSSTSLAVAGGIVQMISHGFVSGAMFLCIGVLYDRVHSREISPYGGVVNTMPKFAALGPAVLHGQRAAAGHGGLHRRMDGHPGRRQGELLGGRHGCHGPDLRCRLHLWMYKRVYFGDAANDDVKSLEDVNAREFTMLASWPAAVLAMGLYPKPFTDVMHVSVVDLIKHVAQSKLVTP